MATADRIRKIIADSQLSERLHQISDYDLESLSDSDRLECERLADGLAIIGASLRDRLSPPSPRNRNGSYRRAVRKALGGIHVSVAQ